MKVRAPVAEFMLNRSESTDPASTPDATIEYVKDAVPSASVAEYVATVVVSATSWASVSPAAKTGDASFTSLTEITTVFVTAAPVPSFTATVSE